MPAVRAVVAPEADRRVERLFLRPGRGPRGGELRPILFVKVFHRGEFARGGDPAGEFEPAVVRDRDRAVRLGDPRGDR